MAHPGEPVGDAGLLFGNLLEDPGPSVAGDVVVALHFAEDLAYTFLGGHRCRTNGAVSNAMIP